MDEEGGHFVATDLYWPREAWNELDEYAFCLLSLLEMQN
jgi:hypothetical protein